MRRRESHLVAMEFEGIENGEPIDEVAADATYWTLAEVDFLTDDEAAGPRVDGHITALRRRRRPRNPHRRRPKPALRNDSRSPPSVAHG